MARTVAPVRLRSEEHTCELQSRRDLVCRLLLEKKKKKFDRGGLHENYSTRARAAARLRASQRVCGDRFARCCRLPSARWLLPCFFFNETATPEIYTLSLHDALPI